MSRLATSVRARVSVVACSTLAFACVAGVGTVRAQDVQPPTASAAAPTEQEPAPPAAQSTPLQGLFSNMKLRGYSDIGFGRPLQEKLPEGGLQGSTYSFQVADLHLFFTSRMSEQWSFLSELLITSDFTNENSAEIDRLLMQYRPTSHLRLGFGKFNAGIGYYPNQYHRAKFYQVATGRPLMFTDEDNGGILPVHTLGVTATGDIPSGSLGLHYIAEVTNGRGYEHPDMIPVQNWVDENDRKAVNGGLFVQPDAVPGLQAGFSVYRDRIKPPAGTFDETITSVHAVYVVPNFEWLNEFVVLRHAAVDGHDTATTRSVYTQVSPRFQTVRPYARFEYQNVPSTDPVFGSFGLRKSASAGLHFDIGQFAVLKTQFDHALQYGAWANGVHVQLAFAF